MAGEGLLNRPIWGPGLLNQRPTFASMYPDATGGASLTAYDPTWRDQAAVFMQGVLGLPRHAVAGLLGSTGLGVGAGPGPGGTGLADLTTVPAIPFYLDEAERAREAGDIAGQAMGHRVGAAAFRARSEGRGRRGSCKSGGEVV